MTTLDAVNVGQDAAECGHSRGHDMGNIVGLLAGTIFSVFGIYAVVTRRVTFGDDGEDLQVFFFGWRAVAIGFAALALAALCFSSAAGLVSVDWR